MKIIIVGCTGFVGREVLAQCRRRSSITSIVLLARRELDQEITNDPKVTLIIVKDFLNFSDEARNKMEGASAAIWTLRADTSEVELDYPLAFAATIQSILSTTHTPFRYLHVSGVLAEKDQQKPLWFLQEGRRVKGMAEIKLKEIAHDNPSCVWETYIVRPSMIIPNPPGLLNSLGGWILGAIRVDQLAAAMIDIVENGGSQQTYENADLVSHAKKLEAAQVGVSE